MSEKVKKRLFWVGITGGTILVVLFVLNLLEGFRIDGPRHHPEMGSGHGRGFETNHMMHGPHHGGDFSWMTILVVLLAGLAAAVLVVKWLRRKKYSFQHFIMDSPIASASTPVNESNAELLDKWEKSQKEKKEKE